MYSIKASFTSFAQNTAEVYDKLILLTMIFKVLPDFGFKPPYFPFHQTEI